MGMFISCDWGTSSFRLRLVDANKRIAIAEVKSNEGIADIHARWKELSRDEGQRVSFYQSIISDNLGKLQEKVSDSLKDLPIIISGMASANIGMVELPYKKLPFAVDGSDLMYKKIATSASFPHHVMVISGAKTADDVMRGEEIQLMGCDFPSKEERVFILPGTHSKHVTVKNKKAIDFKTYMTGEFFQLLSQHSILSKSLHDDGEALRGDNLTAFEEGVMHSRSGNLLHEAFLVRTNHLFGHYTKEVNHYYLSGLLIGTELKELALGKLPLTLVANALMRDYYVTALRKLGNTIVETYDVDVALVNGHCKMYRLL